MTERPATDAAPCHIDGCQYEALTNRIRELETTISEILASQKKMPAVDDEVMTEWLREKLEERLRIDMDVVYGSAPGTGRYLRVRLIWQSNESKILGLGDDAVLIAEESVGIDP